jgi:hypothetical protein
MDAILYVQTIDDRLIYKELEFSGINIQPSINKEINRCLLSGMQLKFVMVEIFKAKHTFVLKNHVTKESYLDYDLDLLYDKIEGNLELEKFLNQCLLIKLDWTKLKEKHKPDPNQIWKNRLN